MQMIVAIVLIVGILCVNGVCIQLDGNALQLAGAIVQSCIEGNHGILVGICIGTVDLTPAVRAGCAELVVVIVLGHFVGNILSAGIGVVDAVCFGIALRCFLVVVDTDDVIFADGIAVGHFAGRFILSLFLDRRSLISDIQMVERQRLFFEITPVSGTGTVIFTGRSIVGILRLILIVSIHSGIVCFHCCVVSFYVDIETGNLIVVVFHSLQVCGIGIAAQFCILTGMCFQCCCFCQQSLMLCGQLVIAVQNIQHILADLNAVVVIAQCADVVSGTGMQTLFQRCILVGNIVVLVCDLLVVVRNILKDAQFLHIVFEDCSGFFVLRLCFQILHILGITFAVLFYVLL